MITFVFYRKSGFLLLAVLLSLTAASGEEETPARLSEKYPDLAQGILAEAILEEMPESELAHIKEKTITRQMLAGKVDDLPEDMREHVGNYLFYILENMVTKPIMLAVILGDDDLPDNNDLVQQRIRDYINNVMGGFEADEAEARKFFDENPEMFSEAEFEDIKEMLAAELMRKKQQEAWEAHIRSMGRKIPLSVNAAWVAEQAEKVKDNLVDNARTGGKPVLAVFSADWCPACKQLKPVLEKLQDGNVEHATILLIDTDVHEFLASRYNVSNIPQLIFFDKDGNEVDRQTGFMSEEDIRAKLKALDTTSETASNAGDACNPEFLEETI